MKAPAYIIQRWAQGATAMSKQLYTIREPRNAGGKYTVLNPTGRIVVAVSNALVAARIRDELQRALDAGEFKIQ